MLLVFKKGCALLHEDRGRAASGVRVVGACRPCLQGITVLKVPGRSPGHSPHATFQEDRAPLGWGLTWPSLAVLLLNGERGPPPKATWGGKGQKKGDSIPGIITSSQYRTLAPGKGLGLRERGGTWVEMYPNYRSLWK